MSRRQTIVHAYNGFASKGQVFLHGRVLKDKNIDYSNQPSLRTRLLNTYKRFESDEIRRAHVRVKYANQQWNLICDKEGYYTLEEEFELLREDENNRWLQFSVDLPDYSEVDPFVADVLLPSDYERIGIVTDIDDTILDTGTLYSSWITIIRNTFVRNHFQRFEVSGASSLLNKLVVNEGGRVGRPLFYLSNSPWNLYNYLNGFISKNYMPKGPILLRDYGLHLLMKRPIHLKHKARMLERIFKMYPNLSFILLGDAASKDIDHYTAIANQFKDRVLAIYIRLHLRSTKISRIQNFIGQNPRTYIKIVYTLDEVELDAKRNGWIVDISEKNG